MIAASEPIQRPIDARLLAIDPAGHMRHLKRDRFIELLRRGDLVIANDAAPLPASLHGTHETTGDTIEVRLAAWQSASADDVTRFTAVVFGAGDYHTATENRPTPPHLASGDRLILGPLTATVTDVLDHPRLVSLRFIGPAHRIWAGMARHGHPIQYAHIRAPLAMWDVWPLIAARPVAFEPPSAGFVLNWRILDEMHAQGVEFATITHAAGISSTGDLDLDVRLPLDEPYDISDATATAIARARQRRGRVVAVGTTVVRALEHAAKDSGLVRAGRGLANQRVTASTGLNVVDAILSGTHEPGTTHYELLRAFVNDVSLGTASRELNNHKYRTHEFGDSIFIERAA